MNSNTPNTSSNYTFESMSRRSSLCPPHHESESVLSPPLTPALSQHHPFDKRHSADLSAYSNNPYNPRPTYSMDSYQQWMHHSATMQHMQQQQQLHHHHHQQQQQHMHHHHQPMLHSPVPNMAQHQQQLQAMPQQQQMQQRSPIIERASNTTRKQPSKQNKHMCTFPECFWSFKRFEHLKRHMLVHTGERPHVCPHPGCGKRFSRSDNFHAHYRTHEKKAFARQKNNNTQQQQQQQQHQDTTALNTNFIIKEEKDFMQPFYQHQSYPLLPSPSAMYNQHYTTMIQQEVSPTPSPRSSIQSSSSSSTSTVSSTHSEDKGEQKKPHACSHPTCNRKFRRLEHLKRHMRIHTHEQPFKCNYPGCLKAFSRSDNLTQHRKTHERRGSRYQAIDAVVPITTTDYMHPSDNESFTFDFIRDSHNNNSYDNNSKQHSILGLQYPGDTATESVGC